MRILLATAHPHLPEIAGGAQSSMHEMALALQERGHEVAILSGLSGDGLFGLRSRIGLKLSREAAVQDSGLGYPVFRSWFAWEAVPEVVKRFDPDIACPHSGLPVRMSTAFTEAGVPTMIYFRNVEADDLGGAIRGAADAYLANSCFTAGRVNEAYGVEADVIRPLFNASRYATQTDRQFVTFINPHPLKGRDIAFSLARECPQTNFLIVRAWTLAPEDEALLLDLARTCPNVTLKQRTTNMGEVYSRTKVVIAPSRWEEAWGRIATEAHFSGIPVIATAIGGLPESVGPGGILIPAEAGVSEWKGALRSILDDEDLYERLSNAALEYSRRPEIRREQQLDGFVSAASRAVQGFQERNSLQLAVSG